MPLVSKKRKADYPVIVPPAYTGVAFLFCWTYLMFYATSAGVEAAAPISLYSISYTLSALSMVITLVIIGFLVERRTQLLISKYAKITTGIGLSTGSALLIINGLSFNTVLLIMGSIVTGVFSGMLSMQWVAAYKRVGLRVAVSSFPTLMAISVGTCITLMYLPREIIALATIALPLVSEFLFHEVRKEPWPIFEDEEAGARDQPINFTLMLLPFAVYALATGFLDYSSNDNSYTFAFYAFGAFVPVVIAGVFMFITERDRFATAFLVPCAFLVAVCVPFLTQGNLEPFSHFISIGELGTEVLLFIVPIGFAHFFSIDSLKTYALGRVVYVVFNAIGWYTAEFAFNKIGAFMHSQMSLLIIFIGIEVLTVCLIIAIVKAQKIIPGEDLPQEEELEPVNGANQPLDSFSEKSIDVSNELTSQNESSFHEIGSTPKLLHTSSFESFCESHGLSKREQEVCYLLAKGYTSARIQKELYIAAGTVNYHSRNIYAKLGVHSKQELIALFESSERQ